MNENVDKLLRYYEEVIKDACMFTMAKLIKVGAINPKEPIKCYIGDELVKEITLVNRPDVGGKDEKN